MKKLSELYELWDAFGNTPVDENELLDSPFLHFLPGTHRHDVWHWFEDQNPSFVAGEVLMGIRRSSEKHTLKSFIVELRIQAGEYEKSCTHLVKAEDEEEAELQAILSEAHNELNKDEENGYFYENDCSFAYIAKYVLEVESDEDYKVLLKYLQP